MLYNKEKLLSLGDRAEAEIAANLHGAYRLTLRFVRVRGKFDLLTLFYL